MGKPGSSKKKLEYELKDNLDYEVTREELEVANRGRAVSVWL